MGLSPLDRVGSRVNPSSYGMGKERSFARTAKNHVHLHSISSTVYLTVDKPSPVVEKTRTLLISFLPLMKKDQ